MTSQEVQIKIDEKETVSGVITLPDDPEPETLNGAIFAHGAANDMNHPLILAVADKLTRAGMLTLRFNFLYREKGKDKPDSPEVLFRTWHSVFRFFAEESEYKPKKTAAIGKSMGGRIAAEMAARKSLPVDALVFLGYPLHMPGKTEKIRDKPLFEIDVPMLFFIGTRDPFCNFGIFESVFSRIENDASMEVIKEGDHSFHVPKDLNIDPDTIYSNISDRTLSWMEKKL